MPLERMESWVSGRLAELEKSGTLKGTELVIRGLERPSGEKGPRYFVEGEGDKEFLKLNSNSYLGMSLREELIEAERKGAEAFGAGPGAVRFIHGTFTPHVELEKRLARFHGREACMIFSSAYAAVCGVISPLITPETVVLSDELNHNSIINALRLSKPKGKAIYAHADMKELKEKMRECVGTCRRLIIITDGVFSMRGDHPDLKALVGLAREYDCEFDEGVVTVMDDSHGVGAYGSTGRGTCEGTGENEVDLLGATLGKALGVNGGYVATSARVVEYLRETSPFYVYSNPITPAEACAALKAVDILDGAEGKRLLSHLREMTGYFRDGLGALGYEIIPGQHPIVAAMIRDTEKTVRLVGYLKKQGVLVVGLKYPVVPRGDECIRFQISAAHTTADLDYVLGVLGEYR